MQLHSKVYIAGNKGLVGSAIERALRQQGYTNILTSDISTFDLTDPKATDAFFDEHKPEFVFLAAAKVGGIAANDANPADFIRINLQIQTNMIDACYRHKVTKLLFLGSSCIYPRDAPQPMCEEHLLTGKLELTNDAYAIAKIAGILMCKSYNRQHKTNFIAAMPTNQYGQGDNFNLQGSHVLPAMIRKFHEGKVADQPTIELWGTGSAKREFLLVEDTADALVFLMNNFNAPQDSKLDEDMFVNVGVGKDISIKEVAELVQEIVGFKGQIVWNTKMPDGTPRKLLNVDRLTKLGWKPKHSLREGIASSYEWFLANQDRYRR
eukprot:NODE_940_length_1220_cov_432.332195_g713_i0.p1 GENE.NODE_940_length_1220_cov_432.332195_g713_i0~~NODE_940_length_1220_cov_432.332195_g713_i0.p1  ORF type:complete len:322 (-),score=79.84 NODE_940_length_1220_cov_432.332195_g713_i0:181-1146(-)